MTINNTSPTLPTITISFPSRNREWVLSHFLDSILKLDYPKHLLSIVTIVNDSTDRTYSMLYDFKTKYEKEYNKIKIKTVNYDTPIYDQERKVTKEVINIAYSNGVKKQIINNNIEKVYENLGKLRNSLLHNCDTDYVFSVDTDILFEPNTLKKLLSHNKDYVSALICNGYVLEENTKDDDNKINAHDITNALYREKDKDGKHTDVYKHFKFYDEKFKDLQYVDENGLLEVDNTGAIFLVSKKAYKSGAKYGYHPNGEDACFAEQLKDKGFEMYCDVNLRCTHIMNDKLLEKWKDGWKW